jgi:CRISPR/Cas system-associated exonuclease Cas4 (RecB family)
VQPDIDALSASKMERAASCTASVILPSYSRTGKLAIAGTERHANLEEGKRAEGDSGFDPSSLDLPDMVHEVAYLIDPKLHTVKRIGAGMPRRYGDGRPWYTVGTTLDVESIQTDLAVAVDWKSRKRVSAAKRNWQVRLQALALWETYRRPVRSGLVYLDNGERDFHDFTRFDHAATWRDLESAIANIESAIGKPAKPHMGPYCDYCDAVDLCPAVLASLRGMMEYSLNDDTLGPLSAAEAGQLYPVLKAVKAKYERMWEALRLRARSQNLPLGNGRHLRMVENNRGTWVLTDRKDE